jgi:uncharacterized protein
MKFLIWIVVIFVALFGLRLLNVASGRRRANPPERDRPQAPPAETMVRCARCGVYLPREDAVTSAAGLTCGDPGCAQRG